MPACMSHQLSVLLTPATGACLCIRLQGSSHAADACHHAATCRLASAPVDACSGLLPSLGHHECVVTVVTWCCAGAAPQQWMTTMAVALAAPTDTCPHLLRLATSLVRLWGACFTALSVAGGGPEGPWAWALPAAHHMQCLLHLVCSRPDATLGEEHHTTDVVLMAVAVTWHAHRRPGLDPNTQAMIAVHVRGLEERAAEGIWGGVQMKLQEAPRAQQQQCTQGCSDAAGSAGSLPGVNGVPEAGADTAAEEEEVASESGNEGEWVNVDELAAALVLLQPQVRLPRPHTPSRCRPQQATLIQGAASYPPDIAAP